MVLNPNIRKKIKEMQGKSDLKLREKKNKKIITFSIDKQIAKQLRYYCEKEGIYISSVVEKIIKKYLEEKGVFTQAPAGVVELSLHDSANASSKPEISITEKEFQAS